MSYRSPLPPHPSRVKLHSWNILVARGEKRGWSFKRRRIALSTHNHNHSEDSDDEKIGALMAVLLHCSMACQELSLLTDQVTEIVESVVANIRRFTWKNNLLLCMRLLASLVSGSSAMKRRLKECGIQEYLSEECARGTDPGQRDLVDSLIKKKLFNSLSFCWVSEATGPRLRLSEENKVVDNPRAASISEATRGDAINIEYFELEPIDRGPGVLGCSCWTGFCELSSFSPTSRPTALYATNPFHHSPGVDAGMRFGCKLNLSRGMVSFYKNGTLLSSVSCPSTGQFVPFISDFTRQIGFRIVEPESIPEDG